MDGSPAPMDRPQSVGVQPQDLVSPLTGLGQIMFQDSPSTGAFFLAGIAIASPLMAAGAALAVVVGTLVAYLLRYDRSDIRDGLYGFNAGLVGIALLFNYEPQGLIFVLIIVGAACSTLVTREMRRRVPFPTYTTPFIVTTWVALFIAQRLQVPAVVHPSPPETLDVSEAIVKGISEVMFQANTVTGMLFLVGILLNSWRAALVAVAGSLIGMLVGVSHHDPVANLALGIYGYNASLAAMAMTLYRRSLLLPLVAAFVSVPITEHFSVLTGLAPLTAPFVLASWLTIALDKADQKFAVEVPRPVQ